MHDVLQIEPMYDSLLYIESIVVLFVFLLMVVQLFDGVLLSAPVIISLMTLVVATVTIDMM
jgi:hypothetical protein